MTDPTTNKNPIDAAKKVATKSQQIIDLVNIKIEARTQCYERIKKLVNDSYQRYYERHPERAVDDRGADGTEWSMNGLQSIINILGDYNISYRDGINTEPLSVQVSDEDHSGNRPSPVARATNPITKVGEPQVS